MPASPLEWGKAEGTGRGGEGEGAAPSVRSEAASRCSGGRQALRLSLKARRVDPSICAGVFCAAPGGAPFRRDRVQHNQTEYTSVMKPGGHWMSAARVILGPWGRASEKIPGVPGEVFFQESKNGIGGTGLGEDGGGVGVRRREETEDRVPAINMHVWAVCVSNGMLTRTRRVSRRLFVNIPQKGGGARTHIWNFHWKHMHN